MLTLTIEGPIGRLQIKLRTFVTLCMLHQRMLNELFDAVFVGRQPPKGCHEMMTRKDPLDFVDFLEVGHVTLVCAV